MKNLEYKIAVGMYEQYKEDVAKVGADLNLAQINTLTLLERNVRSFNTKQTFLSKLVGAFKNRKK